MTALAEVQQREDPVDRMKAPSRLDRTRRALRDHGLTVGLTLLLLWIIGIPLVSAIIYSFRTGTPATPGGFTLENYQQVYTNPLTATTLANSVVVAGTVTLISLMIATVFAWLVERTDMPGRNFAWIAMLLPIAMPGMLSAMGWILLLSPKIGLVNSAAREVLGVVGINLTEGPFDVYSIEGMIFVEAMRGTATLFLMLVAALRLMDPALEEAAAANGVGPFRTFRTVTLRLMLPALLAAGMYGLIGNLDDLEIPLLIGIPAGVFLLPTLIYFTSSNNNWGMATAYMTIFLIITLVMVFIYYRLVIKRAGNFAVVTGKGYRVHRLSLGRWRWPALGMFVAFFFGTIVMPMGILLYASFLPVYEVPSIEAFEKFSMANYAALIDDPQIGRTVTNTIVLAVVTATATTVLAFLVAWLVVRQRVRGGLALEALTFIPHAIPGIAVVVAMVAFYVSPAMQWTHLYGTVALMAIALITRFITFASRTSNSALAQIGKELEEAASTSGVGRFRILWRITLRLLLPAFLAVWIWIVAHAMRNLTVPLVMATSANGTIATTLYKMWQRDADFTGAAALGVALVAVLAVLAVVVRRLMSGGYSESP